MTSPRWLDADQARVWRAYRDMNDHLFARLEEQLACDAGLSGSDYTVLVPLSESPLGVLRARELRTGIGWDRSRLSHHLARMEKRGLVVREECDEDARGLTVRLTKAGRSAIEEAAPGHVECVQRSFFDLMSKKEVETLGAVFERVIDNLKSERV